MTDLEETAREIANAISEEHGHGYTALYDVMERHIAKGLSAVREADAQVLDKKIAELAKWMEQHPSTGGDDEWSYGSAIISKLVECVAAIRSQGVK